MSSQSKSAFRNTCLKDPELLQNDPEIPHPIIAPDRYLHDVDASVQLVDWIVWLKGVRELNMEDGQPTTAGQFAHTMSQCMMTLLRRRRVVVAVLDKEDVPIAKGVTQTKRVDDKVGMTKSARVATIESTMMSSDTLESARAERLPTDVLQNIPEGVTLEQAVEYGFITQAQLDHCMRPEQRRQHSLVLHTERVATMEQQRRRTRADLTLLDSDLPHKALEVQPVDVEGLSLLQRALVAVQDTNLPLPWHEVLSKKRSECIRYLVRALLFSPTIHLCPPRGRRLVIDGHQMSYTHHPCAGDEMLCNPRTSYAERHQPLVVRHPLDADKLESTAVLLGHRVGGAVHCTTVSAEGDATETPQEIFVDDTDVISAHNPLPYPLVTAAPHLQNSMGEADFAIFHYILRLMDSNPELPPIIEISSVDTDMFLLALWFLFKWEWDLFRPHSYNTHERPLPVLYLTSGKQWSRAGPENGSTNMTAMYRRLIKYKLRGDSTRLPQLLCAMTCATGDYTLGYPYVSMNHFMQAFYEYQDLCDPRTEQPYFMRLLRLHASGGDGNDNDLPLEIEAGWKDYRWLVHCAYFVAHKTAFTKLSIQWPTEISGDTMRTIVHKKVTHDVPNCSDDPDNPPPQYAVFEKLSRALSKRLPPEEQIKHRFLLVFNLWLMFADLGHPQLRCVYDLNALGFAPEVPGRPIARDNIRFVAKIDWEDRLKKWMQLYELPTAGGKMLGKRGRGDAEPDICL